MNPDAPDDAMGGAVAAALLSSMGLVPALAGVAGAAQLAATAPAVAHPPTSTTKVTTDQRITTTRVSGVNRYLTAVAISQRAYPDGLAPTHGTVYLARADVYADALAAGTLANGPILLVPRCGTVPPQVIAEVTRLQPDRIAVLGDLTAVCDQVLHDVAGTVPSARYGGSTGMPRPSPSPTSGPPRDRSPRSMWPRARTPHRTPSPVAS